MHTTEELMTRTRAGFSRLDIPAKYVDAALQGLETWLSEDAFNAYRPQIEHLIQSEAWDFLLDAFYQVIPFGTGGRRGLVGIGPNRINPWTIQSSAQGHAQYLIKEYGEEARRRGVVLTYDVRVFTRQAPLQPGPAQSRYEPDLPPVGRSGRRGLRRQRNQGVHVRCRALARPSSRSPSATCRPSPGICSVPATTCPPITGKKSMTNTADS